MPRPRRMVSKIVTAVVAVLLVTVGDVPAADAATTPRPVGTDVSWPAAPDCLRDLVSGSPFAIVGVNDGLPTGTNPCLAQQLGWASTALGQSRPRLEVYVNAANPGDVKAKASWWPSANRTRSGTAVTGVPGTCRGGNTVACAFVYGWSIAVDDLGRGVPAGAAYRWWIDVEKANTWSTSTARNAAVVTGMTGAFTAAHQRVGLYGLPSEVPWLLGTIPATSPLHPLPTWIAGDGDVLAALHRCAAAPFAGGRVMLAQFTIAAAGGALGQDVSCGAISTAKPRLSGSVRSGATLTAHVTGWTPAAAHVAYRWLRDGSAIAGATAHRYRLTRSDRGRAISVEVTGTTDGWSRAVRTSASVHPRS